MLSPDDRAVLELHERFMQANTREDVEFLREHTIGDSLVWYNLNKSNYFGTPHIVELWRMLHETRPDTSSDAPLTTEDVAVHVVGDAAWLTYVLRVSYDFGELATWSGAARATEVWQRIHGRWKLAHCHFSEHEPGHMGGR